MLSQQYRPAALLELDALDAGGAAGFLAFAKVRLGAQIRALQVRHFVGFERVIVRHLEVDGILIFQIKGDEW